MSDNGDGALSWAEAVAVCETHAHRLVRLSAWVEASCPYCGLLEIGRHTFSRADVEAFLREAFALQRREPSRALSRRYWLHKPPFFSRRARYDALMGVLVEVGVVIDRGSRAAGIMVIAPKTALESVERWVRFVGVSDTSERAGRAGQYRALDFT